MVYAHRDFKVNMTKKFELLKFRETDPMLNNGLWTVVYLDFLQKVHQIEFLMVGNPKEDRYAINPLLNHEKSIINSALEKRSANQQEWLANNFVHSETCIVNENCESTDWSSKSPDPFGTIDMTMPEWIPKIEDTIEEPVMPKIAKSVLTSDDYDLDDSESELVNLEFDE